MTSLNWPPQFVIEMRLTSNYYLLDKSISGTSWKIPKQEHKKKRITQTRSEERMLRVAVLDENPAMSVGG